MNKEMIKNKGREGSNNRRNNKKLKILLRIK
jgi:hypothetical protein